jgi:acyl dehydratase
MADALRMGECLFRTEVPGASREAIRLFSEATEDPNPIHVDDEFARSCGFPQVLQQGPMTTAHFARLLGDALGPQRLKALDLSFTAPVFPEEPLIFLATVASLEPEVRLELQVQKRDGTQTAKGEAIVHPGGAGR